MDIGLDMVNAGTKCSKIYNRDEIVAKFKMYISDLLGFS